MQKTIWLGLGLLFFTHSAGALDLGVGVKAGTVGAGVDVTVALTRTINARLSLTNVDIGDEEETIAVGDSGAEGDLDAELGLDFGANALLIDWHVFNGSFHLTAGMMRHTGKVDFSGTLVSSITVDGQALDPSDFSTAIGGEVSLADSYQPYLGFGWGRKAGDGGGISITVDIGIALLSPDVSLEATVDGAGANGLSQAELNSRLRGMEDDAEADLDEFEAWPILSLGVNYAF